MAVLPKTDKSNTQTPARRTTRLSVAIPITISGKDASGRTFKENCRTLIVNKHGARILTAHHLSLGAELLLENRALGQTAKTTVVWLGERPSPKDPAEVGIELVESADIWGIDLPPEDWEEGPSARESAKRSGITPGATAAANLAAPPPVAPTIAEASPPVRLDGSAAAAVTGKVKGLAPGVGASPAVPQSAQIPTRGSAAESFPPSPDLQEAVSEKPAKQPPEVFDARTAASLADLEALVSRAQDLRRSLESLIGKCREDIRSASLASLQSATEDLNAKVRQGLESLAAKIEEHREQVGQHASSTLDELRRKSATLQAELHTALDQALSAAQEKARKEAVVKLQEASSELGATLEKDFKIRASSSLEPLMEELRDLGKEVAEDTRKRLTSLREQAIDGLTKESSKLAEEHTLQLRKRLQEIVDQEARQIETRWAEGLEKHREIALQKIEKQLAETALTLQQKCASEMQEKIREEFLRQIEEAAKEFDKRTAENLDLFSSQLNEKKMEIVAQAAEMFRNTVGQMFLSPQASAKKSSEG